MKRRYQIFRSMIVVFALWGVLGTAFFAPSVVGSMQQAFYRSLKQLSPDASESALQRSAQARAEALSAGVYVFTIGSGIISTAVAWYLARRSKRAYEAELAFDQRAQRATFQELGAFLPSSTPRDEKLP
ncbi:MAG: hypothetical protein OHK0023_12730 [Anaerolineae bacterium]